MVALLVASLALLNVATLMRWRADGAARRSEADRPFMKMVGWIRHSSLAGPFLVPVDADHRTRFDEFQLLALRPVWVDWKQGAAVMWEPALYPRWATRYEAVKKLRRADQFLGYAAANRIPYVVLPKDVGSCGRSRMLYHDEHYSVCALAGEGEARSAAIPISAPP